MNKIHNDFNTRVPEDDRICWASSFNDEPLDTQSQLDKSGIKEGDRVILHQDEDDFEVLATIERRYVDTLKQELIIAFVDGDTLEVGSIAYRLHGIDAPEAGQKCARTDPTRDASSLFACKRDGRYRALSFIRGIPAWKQARNDYARIEPVI